MPRAAVEEIVRRLTRNLESRVRSRTIELRRANQRLLREIDERRAAEERLRESEELYRNMIELSQQLAWTADPDGTISWASPRFAEVIGLPQGTQPEDVWRTRVHPDDLPRLLTDWAEAIENPRIIVVEFRMRVADGSYRSFRGRAAPRRDDRGRVVRWYGFTEDVDDWKQSERARLEAEERYRLAARATNDAIWDLDLVNRRIHWSDTASDILGYPGRRLGSTSVEWWTERVHPEDREAVVASLGEAIGRGKTRWSSTYRFRKGNGDYAVVLDRGFMVRNPSGEAVRAVGAMADLTDRQRAEQEIRRMEAELIHVSRISAMGAMASTLAHELNQPLTAVSNYLCGSRRLMQRDGVGSAELHDALDAAERGALRAGQIVRRLRDLVARGASALRPEELPRLIEEAGVIAFLDAHLLGIVQRVELDPAALWVEADRVQIQQVLINLIRNAVQAIQDSEVREIEVRTRALSSEFVEVCVADTGTGISPSVREALFSAFHGTKPEGLGIGLSISRTIVEAHGGRISAGDRPGGGAIFRFTLRRWEPAQDQS